MARKGTIASFVNDGRRAAGSNHPPVIISALLKAAQGILAVAVILTELATGIFEPLQEILAEVIATGNGALTNFTGTLALAMPLAPGSVVITDGVETFTDDGLGRMVGDATGTGTINYATGDYDVTFAVAVVDTVDITADYVTAVGGVLNMTVDTDETDSGPIIIHGSVIEEDLAVDPVTLGAPTTAVKKALRQAGIYLE